MQTCWFNSRKVALVGMGAAKWTYRCAVFLSSRSSAGFIWNTKDFCVCFEQYQVYNLPLPTSLKFINFKRLGSLCLWIQKTPSCHQNTAMPLMGKTLALSSWNHQCWSYHGNTGWPDSSANMLHIRRVMEMLRLANGQKGFIFMGFWSILCFSP